MVKAELIEEPQVSEIVAAADNIPDVGVALNSGTLIKNSVKDYSMTVTIRKS